MQVEWGRFLRELGAEIPVLQDFAGEEARCALGSWRLVVVMLVVVVVLVVLVGNPKNL